MKLYYLYLKSLLLEHLCPDYEFIMNEVCNQDFNGDLYVLALEVSCGNVVLDINEESKEVFLLIMFTPDEEDSLSGFVSGSDFREYQRRAMDYYTKTLSSNFNK